VRKQKTQMPKQGPRQPKGRRRPHVGDRLLFWLIGALTGFVIFITLWFYVGRGLPAESLRDRAVLYLYLVLFCAAADLGGRLIAATIWPRGRVWQPRLTGAIQRATNWLLTAAVTAAGMLWTVKDRVYQELASAGLANEVLALLGAWVVIRFAVYLFSFWLSRIWL